MTKRWLITGGTGLVGRHLVKMALESGDKVDVVMRDVARLPSGVNGLAADISRPDWLEGVILGGYDCVCCLAYAATDDPAYDKAVTVNSALALMERSAQIGVKHIIFLGSMAVFGENTPEGIVDETAPKLGITEYARNKIAAVEGVLNGPGDMMVSVLHPTGIYDRASKRISAYRDLLRLGYIDAPLTGVNNIVHAQDVARAILACANGRRGQAREEYIINGETISYAEWIAALERRFALSDRPKMSRLISMFVRGPLRRFARKMGWRPAISVPPYKAALYRLQSCFSSSKAQRDFGYIPTRRFIEEMRT